MISSTRSRAVASTQLLFVGACTPPLTNQTTVEVSQFVSQFSVALGTRLPTRTGSTTVTLKPDGSQETTGTKTQGTGTVPSSSGVTAPTISDSTLTPNLAQGPLAVPLDGAGQLMAETGIFQVGQVLDNQISKAFYPKGYPAHRLTLQVIVGASR